MRSLREQERGEMKKTVLVLQYHKKAEEGGRGLARGERGVGYSLVGRKGTGKRHSSR